jgi:hypothetical protein
MARGRRFDWLRVACCGAGARSRGYIDAASGAIIFTHGRPRLPNGIAERRPTKLAVLGQETQ